MRVAMRQRLPVGAEGVIAALAGRWHGDYGTARCPAHDDRSPSLSMRDGEAGSVLVKCHAGCDSRDVIAALRTRGLWPDGRDSERSFAPPRPAASNDAAKSVEWARALWRRSLPAPGTPVAAYLRFRGIAAPVPPTLRFLADAEHKPTGSRWPCMVAAVTCWPSREILAVHRTYLRPDGGGKAPVEPARMMLGAVAGGAVRLAPVETVLAVAEGIETALSFQLATGTPTWAALSAGGIESLVLPPLPFASEIIVAADNDGSGRGQAAAEIVAERWAADGRRVRIAMPPETGTDFNDMLLQPEPMESAA